MSNQIQTVTLDAGLVAFADKKGALHSITAEGAIFKGGAALAALKDVAMTVALTKAGNGRFQPACDILANAFPKVIKAYATLYGDKKPWDNKAQFAAFVAAVEVHKAPEKGWSKKQAEARLLMTALLAQLGITSQASQGEVVNA